MKELTKEQLDEECSKCLIIKSNDAKKVSILLEQVLKTDHYKVINKEEVRVYDHLNEPEIISELLVKNGVKLKSFYESGLSLEEYFKEIIKEVANVEYDKS